MRTAVGLVCLLVLFGLPPAALAEVDVRTPWADVYIGPDGIYVNGPWGRVEVPSSERKRVCATWRQRVEEHYKASGCKVEFDAGGCVIEKVECDG